MNKIAKKCVLVRVANKTYRGMDGNKYYGKNEVAEGYNTNQGKGLVMYWRGPFIPCLSGISMWELMDDSGIWNF